jgi:ABC-2 type transport system permease protein
MRPILVLIRKEFQQILRDRAMLAIIFIAPVLQLVILAHSINTDVRHLKLTILDQDRSSLSRQMAAALQYSGYFDLASTPLSLHAAENQIQNGQASLALVIPQHFNRDLTLGRSPSVQLLVDGQNSNNASIGMGYVTAILQMVSRDIMVERLAVSGRSLPLHLVEAQTRIFYNPNLESIFYMIPGIVTVLLTITTMMLTSMGLVREKEVGTFEQLIVTPIRPGQLLIGKLIPFAVLGFLELALVLGFSIVLFDMPVVGNLLLIVLAVALFLLNTLGSGLFISTISSTQQQAMFVAWFFMIFGLLMSGFFYPVENMPDWAQALTLGNPLRYSVSILRAVLLKGSGFTDLLRDYLSLAALGIIILGATVVRFRAKVG